MTNVTDSGPQLDEKPTKFVPGQPDMWMFVLFESLLFTGYFSVYLVSRTQNEALFLQSQSDLDLRVGIFNTIALLLSSWAIARCVQAARAGVYRSALINAFLTVLLRTRISCVQGDRVGQRRSAWGTRSPATSFFSTISS